MYAIVKGAIDVDPRKKRGYVWYFREGNDSFIKLYLATGNEFALENTIIDLLG